MAGVSLSPSNDSAALSVAIVSASATGANTAVTSVTGQIIRIYQLFLVFGGTTTLTFQDGSTALSGGMPFVANGSIVLDLTGQPWFTCSTGNAFNLNLGTGAVQMSGAVYYTQGKF